ncbi:hypothetical protein [Rhizobium sp. CNPSo 4039]|uniref:hypothetical protein n=1 Tax=Rhizobium sp. CNPSo 4039 TaxID=3021409 RepID=UPI00254AD0F0|nr:hypothetical protein [Rhizobium sp. CNPSo 4039]MDK4713670.1 hypothetical protein [Rhizobium sp. CNPSo 4039]
MREGNTTIYTFGDIERATYSAPSRMKLFEDISFKSMFFQRLDGLLPSEKSVLSLDIFDTLLLRDNSSELTRFVEIGAAMAAIMSAGASEKRKLPPAPKKRVSKKDIDAFLARQLGTKATYRARDRHRGYGEGSLTEIHTVSSRLLSGNDDYREKFISAELQYETTRVEPNGLLLEYIDKHISRGGQVILVTDMYMHAKQVEELLALVNIDPKKFHAIFSSADTLISKACGLLFPEIEKRLGLHGPNFLHVGDSAKGDFRQPISHGWRALHLPVSEIEIKARKTDHLATAMMLRKYFDIEVDIAMPK